MRMSHRSAMQPHICKWDAFNAVDPAGYKWLRYNLVPIHYTYDTDSNPSPIVIPFNGNFYRMTPIWTFDVNTGLFVFGVNAVLITSGTTTAALQSSYITAVGGTTSPSAVYQTLSQATVVKNTTLQQFEISGIYAYYHSYPDDFSKGDTQYSPVYSPTQDAYPSDDFNIDHDYWYVYDSVNLSHTKGTSTGGFLYSIDTTLYPIDGYDEATHLWYVRRAT